jgi:hypothetical protein
MKHKKAIGTLLTVLLLSAPTTPSPALGNTNPTPAGNVWVTQEGGPGSVFGLLEWTPIAGATSYRIHKTGSIRPYWRLFWVMPGEYTSFKVSDKPGAIAVYRVTAVVNSREVLVGRFNYKPLRKQG